LRQLSLPAGGVTLLAEQAITCLMQAIRTRLRRLPTTPVLSLELFGLNDLWAADHPCT